MQNSGNIFAGKQIETAKKRPSMNIKCIQQELNFQDHGRRKIAVTCDGEITSSDGGLVLLGQIEEKYRITPQQRTII